MAVKIPTQIPSQKNRKIVQISAATHKEESLCYVLCDDGTVWYQYYRTIYKDGGIFTEHVWKMLPEIPQD